MIRNLSKQIRFSLENPEGDSFPSKKACPYCGRKFATKSGILRHIDERHSQEKTK